MSDKRVVKILAIDGGGIRGIVPALFLQRLEKDLRMRIGGVFDYIVGTSTGGLLALALSRPSSDPATPYFTAEQMVEFYEKDGPAIFGRKRGIVLSARRPRYRSESIESVLAERFGDSVLSEALCRVIVTAYDMTHRTPKVFLSWRARELPSQDFFCRDVARATTAAPTYFPPAVIENRSKTEHFHLVDGGVFANNPAARGLIEALQHETETSGGSGPRFLLVSLGTGSLKRRYDSAATVDWGLVDWARPILDIVFDGVSDNVHHQLLSLKNAKVGLTHYFRFQGDLEYASDDMDNTSTKNVAQLKALEQAINTAQQAEYAELVRLLLQRENSDGKRSQ